MTEKPSVFISYNHSSAALVTEMVKKLGGIADVHWDHNVGPWESFSDFMNTIRKQDFAVLIVSDSYLRSKACLYEVTQLMGVENWDKKALFVVEDSAKKIFNSNNWIEYIEYWDCQVKDCEESIKKCDVDVLRDELIKLKRIKEIIGIFLQKISDVNIPEMWNAIDTVVERLRIAGKKNTAQDLEIVILDLIESGQNTVDDLMIATNRSRSSILRYISKLKIEGKIEIRETPKRHRVYMLI